MRGRNDGLQHRSEIKGRATDDLQHLGSRGLLLHPLVAFGECLGEPPLQFSVSAL
jgi:hypothetical protein